MSFLETDENDPQQRGFGTYQRIRLFSAILVLVLAALTWGLGAFDA
jgi:hypothetical protein